VPYIRSGHDAHRPRNHARDPQRPASALLLAPLSRAQVDTQLRPAAQGGRQRNGDGAQPPQRFARGGGRPRASRVNFTASAACPWVTLTPSAGTTPATISASITQAAPTTPGAYPCPISINAAGASNTPQVQLTLLVNPSVGVTPGSLSFNATRGSTIPVVRSVSVSGPSTPVNFTAIVAPGANWLSVSPAQGATPANLTLQADPTGLSGGTLNGVVTVTLSERHSAHD
jgi:hypothetical protein